ncbi:MAG: hypothetical protein EOO77_07400 [Oxalobacteraceae bacterium]|nr:MAG: hypothetical protein EOO77_07400 [Oxalobacteraceae bacterium]
MNTYAAAATQAGYTSVMTFCVAALAHAGITPDVMTLAATALPLTFGATLLLSVLRSFLMSDAVTPNDIKRPSKPDSTEDSPWRDPNLIRNVENLIDEDQVREYFRTRAARTRARFGPVFEPAEGLAPRNRYVTKALR